MQGKIIIEFDGNGGVEVKLEGEITPKQINYLTIHLKRAFATYTRARRKKIVEKIPENKDVEVTVKKVEVAASVLPTPKLTPSATPVVAK